MRKLIIAILMLALAIGACRAETVCVYYTDSKGEYLYPVTREADEINEQTLFEMVSTVPFGVNVTSPVPEDCRFVYSFVTSLLAEVGFETISADTGLFAECYARTLIDAGAASYVNIIINGRFSQRYPEDEHVMVYVPEQSGKYIVPVLRRAYEKMSPRFLLKVMSEETDEHLRAIPGSTDDVEIEYLFTDDGRRVMCLDFPMYVFNALEDANETRWQFLAAVSLTLLSNLTDIDCVRISFSGQLVNGVPDRDGSLLRLEDGLIDRHVFMGYVGSGNIYEYYISSADARNIRALLCAALPEYICETDITDWSVTGGNAEISLSRRFYEACEGIDADTEHYVIYSMVNTVCSSTFATKVHFTLEGNEVETLAGSICLSGYLSASY